LITINYIKIRQSPQGLSIPKLAYNLAKAKTLSESIENGKNIAKTNLVSDLHDLELAITNYENDLERQRQKVF
jgi:hypothetical protein